MNKEIRTQRLILRPIELTDAPAIFQYASNPNVAKWVTWEPHKTIQDSEKFIQFVFQNEALGNLNFAICLKENPDFMLGDIGLRWVSQKNKIMELGTVLNESYWGKGYVTEAFKAVINFAFKNLDVVRIQGQCKKGNSQSRRMMEKAGLLYEGMLHSNLFCKNQSWDMEMLAIIKKGP